MVHNGLIMVKQPTMMDEYWDNGDTAPGKVTELWNVEILIVDKSTN